MVKEAIACAPILWYYDPSAPLLIQCDSSQYGLGAVLLQNDKPLDFRSRTLTETEQRYAQIEKELLAVVFALERSNDYTFGNLTTVHSNHKPLVLISQKPLHSVPRRLQRILIRLQRYNRRIVFQPGSQLHLADTLSRASLPGTETEHEFEHVQATQHLAVSEERLAEIRNHTGMDETMTLLRDTILKGWPEHRRDTPQALTPFFIIRDELAVSEELIFKGDKLVVPRTLQGSILMQIHSAHLGVNHCVIRARELFFWPGMTSQIKDYIASCLLCQQYGQKQQKEPMALREIPDRPWQTVAADLFEHAGKEYIILVDYYSDFFEIEHLPTTTAQAVIKKLRGQFVRCGIPDIFISDNGPQFNCHEFQTFTKIHIKRK